MSHSHDGAPHSHSHTAADHGHTHEILDGPGSYLRREMPLIEGRDWEERAFTIGIGGYVSTSPILPHTISQHPLHSKQDTTQPISSSKIQPLTPHLPSPVGSGKTALMLQLCTTLRSQYSIAAVTNDIFTREDCEFLTRHNALPSERIVAVETGGCPHAAVREDISTNLLTLTQLHGKFDTDLLLIESGGDNLAANYSRELADYIIYVIDVSGGDKIPRKGGPGITQSDVLVVNKVLLAEAVGADLGVMERDARRMREGGPTIFAEVKHGRGVEAIVDLIISAWKASGAVQAKKGKGEFRPVVME
jgi:urease accessory protein